MSLNMVTEKDYLEWKKRTLLHEYPVEQQAPFESEWHRLLKQSQVQQKRRPDLMEIQRETIRQQSQPAPDKTRDIGATLDTCEMQHQREHIWNMLVLAAESSRYNT